MYLTDGQILDIVNTGYCTKVLEVRFFLPSARYIIKLNIMKDDFIKKIERQILIWVWLQILAVTLTIVLIVVVILGFK